MATYRYLQDYLLKLSSLFQCFLHDLKKTSRLPYSSHLQQESEAFKQWLSLSTTVELNIREELFRTKHRKDFDDDRVGSSWKGLPLTKSFNERLNFSRKACHAEVADTCCALSKAAPARADTEKKAELTLQLTRDGNRQLLKTVHFQMLRTVFSQDVCSSLREQQVLYFFFLFFFGKQEVSDLVQKQ